MSTQPVNRLPRRDLLILPLLSISTLVLLFLGSELTARFFFPETSAKACEINDTNIGRRFRPNCTARMKSAEGPWVVNQYNDCGYRTTQSCRPKSPGTIRIALLGSSNSEGLFVAADKIFSEQAATQLTALCRRPVEIQNMGREACDPICSYRRIDEALALQPDVVVLAISPHDIDDLNAQQVALRFQPITPDSDQTKSPSGLFYKLKSLVISSRAATMAQHLLFQDPATYLRLYLNTPSHTGYLTTPLSPAWESHLQALDTLLGEEAQKLHQANVPFVLVEVPNLAQASLLSTPAPLPGFNAYAFNQRLAEIASSHGIQFVNVLDAFKHTPNSNRLYYVVDGHLGGDGQALISEPLAAHLVSGPQPAITGCSTTLGNKGLAPN